MPATVSIILAALFPFQVAAQTAQVESFSPRGEVQNVRQVRARFSVPIVAFGSAATEPFEIECTAGGSGRWIDTRNWVYDFEKDLQAGVACSFAIKENLKAFDGRQVVGERTFSFTTGGPSIVRSWPYEGNESIDEEQVFILELNGPALPESVREHAGFAIEDNAERVGVRVLTSEERRSVLDTQYRFRGRDPENVVLVQSLLKFPVGKAVRLLWGRGIESHSGVKRTSEQLLVFRTREAFTANLHCPRENARSNCIPISDIKLSFSAPVSWKQVRPIVLTEDGGRVWPAARFPYDAEQEMIRGVRFEGPFPPESIFSLDLPAEIRDDAGRPLENAERFPLQVRTAAHPPLAKFSGRFGIIEANAEPLLPVTMRNLEPQVAGRITTPLSPSVIPGRLLRFGAGNAQAVFGWLGKLIEPEHQARESSIFAPNDDTEAIRVPKPNGAKAFEVVGIPMPRPGFYVVELESERLGRSLLQKDQPLYVRTGALVTNMAVHFKRGRESSLAWVTTLDAGEPVADARISLWDCAGNVHWTGTTDASGIVRIPEFDSRISRCGWQRYRRGVLVVAEKAEDLSFTHTSWNEGIEPWRFRLPYATVGDPIRVHTIFGRTLVRAGETIHMKHVMRRPTMQGFERVKAERAPSGLLIRHGGSGQEYQFGLKWREDGTALFDWIIPRQAKLGQYEVYAIEKLGKRTGRQRLSGSFRVEEFRIPLMKAVVRSPGESLIAPSEVSLDLSIRYLSGGAAGGLPARFRYRFAPMTPPPASGFDGFTFANGPTPGTRAQSVRVEPGVPEPKELRSLELVMDTVGGSKVRIDDVPLPLSRPTEVQTELEFRDPNGEVQTVSQRVPLWPSAKLVGLKPDSWTAGADDLKFQVAVTEIDGTPSAGSEVRVDLYQRKTYSHRKRLVGGYYAYDHRSEVTRIETVCAGVTDGRGLLFCEGASPVSGNVILEAFVQDEAARASYAHRSLWVAGDADWWFEATDHDRIDLIPGQPRYEPGETARFQVRMPFRKATALVTVEREGILESHVTSISGKNPVVEIPVRDNHAPNVFVSVLVVRGRRSEVQPTALIDLGRPTYRLGISEIRVGGNGMNSRWR